MSKLSTLAKNWLGLGLVVNIMSFRALELSICFGKLSLFGKRECDVITFPVSSELVVFCALIYAPRLDLHRCWKLMN